MKIIIMSDIHHSLERAQEVLSRHRNAEYLLFLGDGERAFAHLRDETPIMGFVGVSGNCDGYSLFSEGALPDERVLDIDGVKIYMTHGHRTGTTDSTLGFRAFSKGADVALYGHTHVTHLGEYIAENGKIVQVFNPGSIGEPRGGSSAGYGIMEIKKGVFTLSHYEY